MHNLKVENHLLLSKQTENESLGEAPQVPLRGFSEEVREELVLVGFVFCFLFFFFNTSRLSELRNIAVN